MRVRLSARGVSQNAPTTDPRNLATKRKLLRRLIGAFKTLSTKHVNDLRDTPGPKLWQRNYYEHIIRNDHTLHRARGYVVDNTFFWPANWENHTASFEPPDL